MNKLIVFIGYPAAGKTTLANAFMNTHSEYKMHDVYQYIKKYKRADGTLISEDHTITAYTDMYKDLERVEGNIILELGTNHHEFNAQHLKELSKQKDLIIFLCLLSKEECLKREEARDRIIEKEAMLRKFERNFPKPHEEALANVGINYHYLQMGSSIEELIKTMEEKINE